MLPKLSNIRPMQARSSSEESESASNDQLWRFPTSLIRSVDDTAGNVIDERRPVSGVDGRSCVTGDIGTVDAGSGIEASSAEIEAFRDVAGEAVGDAGIGASG